MSDSDILLPQDLIILEILKRLPVNSLLRFRSVSKQWRVIIDSPYFTKSQLNHAANSKSTTCVVFHNGPLYNLIHLSSLHHREVTPDALRKLDFPHPIENHTRFLGSIDGLMCIYIANRGVLVWNPSIGTKRIVPGFELGFAFWFWGFGYDSVSDDYKVIRIASVPSDDGSSIRVFVWVYSFKSGDWRRISDIGYHLVSGQMRGIFVENAVHWVVCRPNEPRGSSLLIGALDMRDDKFRLLPKPPDCIEDDICLMYLANLDGSLCACNLHRGSGAFDLWVMKEYGVKESWNRVIRLDYGSRMLVPVTLSEDRKELLVEESFLGCLLWYDVETGLLKRKVFGLSPVIGVPCVHIPSLVRLDVEN